MFTAQVEQLAAAFGAQLPLRIGGKLLRQSPQGVRPGHHRIARVQQLGAEAFELRASSQPLFQPGLK